MTEPKLKTVAIQPRTAAALAWVLQEEIDIAKERGPGLSLADAKAELADLDALRALLGELGGAEARRIASIDVDLASMRNGIIRREKPVDPRRSMEAEALAAYRAAAGQIVLCTEVECYDATGASVTAHCEPPAILRIHRYGTAREMLDSVVHWTDDDHLDPRMDVEVLEPHPAFAGLRPSWVYGTCRSVEGHVEPAPFRLADEAARIIYGNARGLGEDEVAPSAGPTP